jgi:hypothetical protein
LSDIRLPIRPARATVGVSGLSFDEFGVGAIDAVDSARPGWRRVRLSDFVFGGMNGFRQIGFSGVFVSHGHFLLISV